MGSAGISIGELVGTISLNDLFSPALEKAGKSVGLAGQSMAAMTAVAGGVVGAVTGATAAIVALGERGADVTDVQSAFEGLSGRVGETSAAMLGALQQGTLGTISNFDLMKASAGVLGDGLIKSHDDMLTLAAGAQLLGDRTGKGTAAAFDALATAMEKGRDGGLKSLGLFIDSKTAVEEYAQAVHKNVGDLSDHERATALSKATLEALHKELQDAGPASVDFGDRIKQGQVAVQNFTDNLAVAIANSPAIAAGMDGIAAALQGAFGGDQQTAVQTLSGYVNKFAIFLVQVAETAVSGAKIIVDAWYGVSAGFNAVLGVLTTGLGQIIGGFAEIVDKAALIPGVGDKFAGVSTTLHGLGDDLLHVATGFDAQATEALDSAATTGGALDALHATLDTVEASMRAVDGAQVAIHASGPPAFKDTADAATLTAAQIKAIEDATRNAENAMFDLKDNGAKSFQDLQDQLTLANLAGTDARLFQIQQDQAAELAGVQGLALAEPVLYQQMTDDIITKYQLQAAAAQGYFANAALFAQSSGIETRDQMEQNVASALVGYQQMLESGQFTAGGLAQAWQHYIDSKKKMDDDGSGHTKLTYQDIATAASTILSSVFGKNKTAAIAGALIDASAAIVKCFAQFGWWGFIPAAAVAAQTAAHIHTIESTNATFATGTPGTSFVDFGRGTPATLHGNEAVINASQGSTLGEVLAGMVGDALTAHDAKTVTVLEKMRNEAATDRRLLPIWVRDAVMFAGA